MRYVLFRDDDLNYFTPFSQLEKVYGFMFDKEIPINFSAIPAVNGAAKTIDPVSGETIFEPFIPKDVAGKECNFSLLENQSLLSQLNTVHSNEYLHHGFEHSGTNGLCEFETNDVASLTQKLDEGSEILTRCFGKTPDTFVAPQDKYSLEAIKLIQTRFNTFSLGWIDRRRLPKASLAAYCKKRLFKKNHMYIGKLLMTEHPGCNYSQYVSRGESDKRLDKALKENDVTIIVTHHWEFFRDGKLIDAMWKAFRDRVSTLRADKNTQLITFSELYSFSH